MSEKGSNQQHLRKKNSQLIQKYIYQHSPVSRVEIAQALGLTTATITGLVTPLLSQGLLQETHDLAAVKFFCDFKCLHSENLSRITRITPSSSLEGAVYLAKASSAGWELAMA